MSFVAERIRQSLQTVRSRFVAQRNVPPEISKQQIKDEIPVTWEKDNQLWGYVSKYMLKGSGAGFVTPPYSALWERVWGAVPIEDLPKYKDLYNFTPYIKAAIDVTVNLGVSNGFELYGGDDTVRQWLADWLDEQNILHTLRIVATDILVFGNAFIEICRDEETGEVAWLKPLDPVHMRVRRNEYGDIFGYIQLLTFPPVAFEAQDMVHFRWGAKSWWYEFSYGTSLLRPLLKVQALIDQLEDDMAVIVYSYPPPSCYGRRLVLPRITIREMNKQLSIISRVVIHPKYRTIGLGAKLIRETLPLAGTSYVEMIAVMAKYNPFAEKAGMRIPTLKIGIPTLKPETKTEITNYLWQLQKDGCTESTLTNVYARLTRIAQTVNILEPEEVKEYLAKAKMKNSTKTVTARIFNSFYKYKKVEWKQPKYETEETLPFIPQEKEIDALIAATNTVTSTALQLLKETGARGIEITKLQWQDIDSERKVIQIKPAKGSNPRILPASTKLLGMLNSLPKNSDYVFNSKLKTLRTNYENQRNLIAKRFSNPRLKQIHFHTLRHWKGTTEYHLTKDIVHVKYVLGHKCIDSTIIYINLEQALYTTETDTWITTVTHNETEELKAIEANFTLVRAINETTAIYKKRK